MKFYLATPDSGTAAHEKIWGGIGMAVLLAAIFLPLDRLGILACPLKSATGIPCFLCGGTRGFLAAAHLDLASAWSHNPFALALFVGLLLYMPYALGAAAFSWPRPRVRLETDHEKTIIRILILATIAANWTWLLLHN